MTISLEACRELPIGSSADVDSLAQIDLHGVQQGCEIKKKVEASMHPCFMLWLTAKASKGSSSTETCPFFPVWYYCLMMLTNFSGHP